MEKRKAILHVDGDSFFASCEVALNPRLKGKPVVTGLEKGIASAMTYEAKAKGVHRGMPLFQIRKVCPEAVILPSDYQAYGIFSQRMVNIVKRYTSDVEDYSIDECFADFSEIIKEEDENVWKVKAAQIAESLRGDLERDLGITFSLGIAPTKVLAKVASKWKKPRGLTALSERDIPEFLKDLPIGKVWGIGPATSIFLSHKGVKTALDFALKSEAWVTEHLAKPYLEIWHELNGRSCLSVQKEREALKSISRTRTFSPPSSEKKRVLSELSKNAEKAAGEARKHHLAANHISFFIKTQEFKYFGSEFSLGRPVSSPEEIVKGINRRFGEVWRKGVLYRATGVTLRGLQDERILQGDLFGETEKAAEMRNLYKGVDRLRKKYGKYILSLGSSLFALGNQHEGEKGEKSFRDKNLWKGETEEKKIGILSWGNVS